MYDLMWETGCWTYKQPVALVDHIAGMTSRRCEDYVCPSWSWVSKESSGFSLNPSICDHRPEYRGLDGQVQKKGMHSFGRISKAVLHFHGLVATLSSSLERDDSLWGLRPEARRWRMRQYGNDHVAEYKWEFYLDWIPPPNWNGDSGGKLKMALLGSSIYYENLKSDENSSETEESEQWESTDESGAEDSEPSDLERDNTSSKGDTSDEGSEENTREFWGLLLHEVEPTTSQPEEQCYVRVGIFKSSPSKNSTEREGYQYFEDFGHMAEIQII